MVQFYLFPTYTKIEYTKSVTVNNQSIISFYLKDIDFYQWDIDFYPRGIRYGKAQIINVYNLPGSEEIPEVLLRTVRLSVTCKSSLEMDQRFMVSFKNHQINM